VILRILPILLGALITTITAEALGLIVVHHLRVKLSRMETWLFAFLSGSASLSVVIFLMCSLGIARKGVFITLFLLVNAVAFWYTRPHRARCVLYPSLEWRQLLVFVIVFLVYGFIYFINALAPETSMDGTTYHLGSVIRWWSEHGFLKYTGSMYANLSQGLELLFLMAFSIGHHSAAKLVHFTYLLVLPWVIISYGRRFNILRSCVAGAALVYLSPVVGLTGTVAYNDVAGACIVFGLFYALQLWDDTKDERLLIIAGLLAGFAYAVKYTGGLAIPYAFFFVSWRLLRSRIHWIRPLAMLGICILVPTLPWLIKNAIWTGNPFSPFFNQWFPNPHIHVWFEKQYVTAMRLYPEIKSRSELPWMYSISGAYIGGLFGPWLLFAPLALLSATTRQGRRLLLAAFIFGLPALTNCATRMLFPFVVFCGPALGIVLAKIPDMVPAVIAANAVLSWPSIVAMYAHPYAWRFMDLPITAALRVVPETDYLKTRVGVGYEMSRAIEELVPKGAQVYMLWQVPQAYTTRRLWNHYESATGQKAFRFIWTGYNRGMQPTSRMSFRFPSTNVAGVRVVQDAKREEMWDVSEIRVYYNNVEIARRPDWKVSARPSWWDSPYAFDNNEATFWSTWQAIEPGMYIEELFRTSVQLDQLVLDGAEGQRGIRLRLLGRGVDGRWRTLSEKMDITSRDPAPGLRQAAMRAVKQLGFDYLVARDDEEPGKDLYRNATYWGITCVRELSGARLYRIN
jgi:4-amino-4-deoxy-L-arabinose transferase-like glycosyltransferase